MPQPLNQIYTKMLNVTNLIVKLTQVIAKILIL